MVSVLCRKSPYFGLITIKAVPLLLMISSSDFLRALSPVVVFRTGSITGVKLARARVLALSLMAWSSNCFPRKYG